MVKEQQSPQEVLRGVKRLMTSSLAGNELVWELGALALP